MKIPPLQGIKERFMSDDDAVGSLKGRGLKMSFPCRV